MNPEIERVIQETIKLTVNGKIDAMRSEQTTAHQILHEEIEGLKKSISELLEIFKNTSAFFRAVVKIAQFIIPVGAAIGVVIGLFKWIRNI